MLYRKKGPAAQPLLEQFIVEAGIEIVDLTKNQATLAFELMSDLGKGWDIRLN